MAAAEGTVTLHDSERQHILRALEQAGWRIYGPLGAANRLGINPNTLRSRMKKLGLSRPTSLASLPPLPPFGHLTSSSSSTIVENHDAV